MVVCFNSIRDRFQAKGVARTFRIQDGGENATDAEGLGFGWDDEAIVREVGVWSAEHAKLGIFSTVMPC